MGGRWRLSVLVVSVVLGLAASLSRATAAARFPPLQAGMAYHDVVFLWGTPDEKSERETRREDLWRYPQGEVLFREGIVVNWKSKRRADEFPETKPKAAPAPRKDTLETEEFDELLNEIMQELPDEPATPGSSITSTTPPAPSNPAAIAGLPPPPLEED